ncbi:hypothetical protein BV25DRAFT_1098334 [Artomyces pyxidatus]|uniref:Uncharacterized protein n=1 Tax=Artomyces pyxidatus TaxID=48021 RepID=A0ACB8TG86_9AGAM|nr:hypothetical protein BV25DRAFT_1098334 [Artomyces pyxidatus]
MWGETETAAHSYICSCLPLTHLTSFLLLQVDDHVHFSAQSLSQPFQPLSWPTVIRPVPMIIWTVVLVQIQHCTSAYPSQSDFLPSYYVVPTPTVVNPYYQPYQPSQHSPHLYRTSRLVHQPASQPTPLPTTRSPPANSLSRPPTSGGTMNAAAAHDDTHEPDISEPPPSYQTLPP